MLTTLTPLVLDIETLALPESLAVDYPREEMAPPSNYAKPEAIDGWHTKNEAKWRASREKECALNPRLGRVLCLGMKALGRETVITYAQTVADEPELLRDFWEAVALADGRVVTWNGGFDLRFLIIRSLVHGVTPTLNPAQIRAWFKRYDLSAHFDVKAALLQEWGSCKAGEGLDEWAQAVGVGGKVGGIDGSAISSLYQRGEHETIRTYCAGDVELTEALYRKAEVFFGS